MTTFRIALIFGFSMAVTAACAADILVESRAGGVNFAGYKELSGKWLDSNNPPETSKSSAGGLSPQTVGSRKTFIPPYASGSKTDVTAAARFSPTIETAGDYHVYVTFPRAANATPVRYVIHHGKGEDKTEITQDGWGATGNANSNKWIDLGSYGFTAGSDQYVEMQVLSGSGPIEPRNPVQAFSDAVRFSTDVVASANAAEAAVAAVTAETPAPGGVNAPAPVGSPGAAPNPDPIKWETSLPAGRAAAAAKGKKMLVYFYSPQSSRSIDYETQVLNSATVKAEINQNFVAVKIDLDVERELAAKLQIFRAGTLNVYDANTGGALETISDTPQAGELVQRLNGVK